MATTAIRKKPQTENSKLLKLVEKVKNGDVVLFKDKKRQAAILLKK